MSINTNSRTFRVIFAVVAVLVIYKMVFWFGDKPTTVPYAPTEIGETVGDEAPTAEEEIGTSDNESEAATPAKRIVPVPDTSTPSESRASEVPNPFYTPFDKIVEMTAKHLERALEGDVNAAFFVHQARQLCRRVPKSEATRQVRLNSRELMYEQLLQQGSPRQPDGALGVGPLAVYPDDEQQRQHLARWTEACNEFDNIFTNELRDELIDLAENGSAVGRYLYALWQPVLAPSVASFNEMQTWQLNALRFSYANLEEGEALGLLAFGQSYSDMLFTLQNLSLGLALKKAAVDCGLNIPMIETQVQILDPGTTVLGDWPYESSRGEMLAMAMGLAEQFCR